MGFLRLLLPLPAFFLGTCLGSLVFCFPLWVFLRFFTAQSLLPLLADIGERGLEGHWFLGPIIVVLMGFAGGCVGYVAALQAASQRYYRAASWQVLVVCLMATGGILTVEFVLIAQGRFWPGKAAHAVLQLVAISAAAIFGHIRGLEGIHNLFKGPD
jgi:hypothetical protein